jgi:8-hydroxy-5-deazaflavin:NADPH oxidoreductase
MSMKKIGVLGTGMVGTIIAEKLLELGYEVSLGSRSASNEKLKNWIKSKSGNAHVGSYDQTVAFADIIFLCVKGEAALDIVKSLNPLNIKGKTLIDLTNPLDFSKGMPPSLFPELVNTNSLGEEIQKAIPEAHVVKTLNIVNATIMVTRQKPGIDPTMFVSGNSQQAKQEVIKILNEFGWLDVIDLGDISTARGTEMLLPLWVRTMTVLGHPNFAFKAMR